MVVPKEVLERGWYELLCRICPRNELQIIFMFQKDPAQNYNLIEEITNEFACNQSYD